ncbi:MAG: preprotein translocase subunit YajC [Deltaproteobacteria bacterium]|nr:preprotein translocase subunit YajC [Deltaproteobacteria bacterium]
MFNVDIIRNQVVAQAQGGGGIMEMLFPLLIVFAIFYFLMIRPQQKQMKKHKEMLDNLKRGDNIVTNGGIIGKIYQINGNLVMLEVADDIRIKVLKNQIAGLFTFENNNNNNAKKEE